MKKLTNFIKDTSIDTGAGVAGAGVGLLIGGPIGAILGGATAPVITDIFKRILSYKEQTRIEQAITIAGKIIQKKIDNGEPLSQNYEDPKLSELFEGILLSAKDAYEDKKIPLLANLFATAPFTNTPLGNMVQTLITMEQLSYRQLCVVSVVGIENNFGRLSTLSSRPMFHGSSLRGRVPDEKIQGIYEDINHLIILGIVGQIPDQPDDPPKSYGLQEIIPSKVYLMYSGKLLFDSLQLDNSDNVEKTDYDEITEVLRLEL